MYRRLPCSSSTVSDRARRILGFGTVCSVPNSMIARDGAVVMAALPDGCVRSVTYTQFPEEIGQTRNRFRRTPMMLARKRTSCRAPGGSDKMDCDLIRRMAHMEFVE